ncbi:hypothetical protein Vadar_017038 [Vaccinium darrowii]|uniref:Uncharacterized protein n=1 Tax=Vaccinium darrowii TaxID=229202 RepID=A0ACB7Y0D3_9ERIC|nr:hypothetical protein Vadar_017038 [Vaccinium darrowii]
MPQSPLSETLIFSTCKHSFPSELSLKEDGKPKNPQESATVTTIYPRELFGLCKQIVAELLGTYILVFVGCVADIVCRETLFTIAIVWGLVWLVLVYALGHISGAHINPAVAIALVVAHRFPFTQVSMYVLAQLIGATLACLNLRVLFHHQQDMMSTLIQYPSSTTVLPGHHFWGCH